MLSSKAPSPLPVDDVARVKEAGLWEITAFLMKRRFRFRVEGQSMLPVLKPKDLVFARPVNQLSIGDVIVLRHPFKTNVTLIKDVAFVNEKGAVYVLGTNLKESTDSRTLGWVLPEHIYGRVQSRIRP